jgi:hypothetical protein
MIWLNENRKSITKPGMGVTDVAKAAGVQWGKLGDKSVSIFIFYVFNCLIPEMGENGSHR